MKPEKLKKMDFEYKMNNFVNHLYDIIINSNQNNMIEVGRSINEVDSNIESTALDLIDDIFKTCKNNKKVDPKKIENLFKNINQLSLIKESFKEVAEKLKEYLLIDPSNKSDIKNGFIPLLEGKISNITNLEITTTVINNSEQQAVLFSKINELNKLNKNQILSDKSNINSELISAAFNKAFSVIDKIKDERDAQEEKMITNKQLLNDAIEKMRSKSIDSIVNKDNNLTL